MTKPLAMVCYEGLLPGSQLLNRLQDLGYRVHPVNELASLVDEARKRKPMVALIDLAWKEEDACARISEFRQTSDTQHIPIIAFTDAKNRKLQSAATTAGATLVASNAGVLSQLPRLLEQALEV